MRHRNDILVAHEELMGSELVSLVHNAIDSVLESKNKTREQKLVDICFQIGLLISDTKYDLYKKTKEEKVEWIANQLRQCGFDTQPMGASWGVLKTK